MQSHKAYVSDIQFVPVGVKVDKKNPSEGRLSHFVSVSEDGSVNIWDSRIFEKGTMKNPADIIWRPF
jgi:hypothetical protein